MKQEGCKFRLSVSCQPYADKNLIPWGSVNYRQQELTVADFVEKVRQGHCFCQCFKSEGDILYQTEKRDSNFMSAQMLFVDIDDAAIPMGEFVAKLTRKPTVAYTTPNNHTEKSKWLYRFRLCYLMDEPITDCKRYGALYDGIMRSICQEVEGYRNKDDCGRKPSQQFSGNPKNDCELIETECVYTSSDFPFENNNALASSSLKNNNINKNNIRLKDIKITDAEFLNDFRQMDPSALIEKYSEKYYYFTHSILKYENGYALIPKDYQEIHRTVFDCKITNAKGEQKHYNVTLTLQDGQQRRKKLYIAALIMKKILPSISFEHLLYNLVRERQDHYDNSDGVLTDKVLADIAKSVVRTPKKKIRLKSRHKRKYVTDAEYCAERGISRNAMKNKVKAILNDEKLKKHYDTTKSVQENLKLLHWRHVKVKQSKLYEWCKQHGIPTKGTNNL